MRTINAQRVVDDTLANGGGTFNLRDGKSPTSGYAVSIDGSEVRVHRALFDEGVVRDYVDRHRFALTHDSEAHIGAHLATWVDGDDVVLDVTHVYRSQLIAERVAIRQAQLAYYDLGSGTEIRTGLVRS